MNDLARFLKDHQEQTRRHFLSLGVGGATAVGLCARMARGEASTLETAEPELAIALTELGPFLTTQDKFQDVSRGKPLPHSLPDETKRAAGLTRESWRLELISDPEHPAAVRKPLTKADGTALDFAGLVRLADKHAVRFAKVMTCLNIGCPLGTGIWEGIPLRELVWMTRPGEDVRRVFYYGYHNDDPRQMFRSSLPIGRVLEDPFDLPPVILCYKLNGQWLSSERGGPVRIVVPEHYGFKSIKWLTHVVLSNLAHANDTYANDGNDVDSPLKTFAATLSVPREIKAGQAIPVTGYAQVGIGGLSKVQVLIQPSGQEPPSGDPHFHTASWTVARILSAPTAWGGGLPFDKIPADTHGFDSESGQPRSWPLRLCKVHWAALLPGLAAGKYTLRCRTIDEKGQAQPMPRPFRKSGHAAIEQVGISVE